MFKFNRLQIYNFSLLLLYFLISVTLRIDNLSYPLGRGHEYITGHTLVTESVFYQEGILKHAGAPVWTYGNSAEKYLMKKGNSGYDVFYGYYFSYPPFAFLLPYFVIWAGVAPSVIFIRVLGLAIHFVCAVLIFYLVNFLTGKKSAKLITLSGHFAALVYLFSAGNLWFHGNIYFADTLVPVFCISFLFLFSKMFIEEKAARDKRKLLLLGLVTFLGVYTEWVQLFYALFACFILFLFSFRQKRFWNPIFVISGATILSLSLTIFQYTRIYALDTILKISMNKYRQRSGQDNKIEKWASMEDPGSMFSLSENYERQYGEILNLVFFSILIVLLIFLFSRNRMERIRKNGGIIFTLLLSILPGIMHIYVFYNFNVIHDFGTLKFAAFFSMIVGISFESLRLFLQERQPFYRYFGIGIYVITVVIYLTASINKYYENNNSNQINLYDKSVGSATREFSAGDEILFLKAGSPVTTFYAQRNFEIANNAKEAIAFLKEVHYPKGIFIECDDNSTGLIIRMVKVNIEGDSIEVKKKFIPQMTDPF